MYRTFRKALAVNPNLTDAHLELGVLTANRLRPISQAFPHLENALRIDPLSLNAAAALVQFLYYVPARHNEMLIILERLGKQYADHPTVIWLQAHRAWTEGHLAQTVPLLEQAVLADPEDYRSRFYLNAARFSLGETERALEAPYWQPQWRLVLSPDREESLNQMKALNREGDSTDPVLSAYVYVMLRDWQAAIDALENQVRDLDQFRNRFAGNLAKGYSPALSLAVAFRALGDEARYRAFAALEREALKIRWENGKIHNAEYSRSLARMNAMEGRPYEATLELEQLFATGPNDPRELLHPVFDDMRDLPEFRDLQDLLRQRVNEEREKLGLAPLPAGQLTMAEDGLR